MTRKIELKTAGQEAILQVHSCGLAKVGKYPEVEFSGLDDQDQPAMIAVNQKSVDRQLARLNLDYGSAAGRIIKFSRSANPADASKPYWNLDDMGELDHQSAAAPIAVRGDWPLAQARASGSAPVRADSAPQPTAASVTPGVPDGGKPETPRDIYMAITKDTLAHVVPLYLDAGVEVDASAVAAIVATRFIAATRNGH